MGAATPEESKNLPQNMLQQAENSPVATEDGSLLEHAVKRILSPCVGISLCTGTADEGRDLPNEDVEREEYFSISRIRRIYRRLTNRMEGVEIEFGNESHDESDMSEISAQTLEELDRLRRQLVSSSDEFGSIGGASTSGSELSDEAYATFFHTTIQMLNWNLLKFRLKQMKWEKECQSTSSRSDEVVADRKNESLHISGLMARDKLGRTPLSLACTKEPPTPILQQLVEIQPMAASVPDSNGQYAIHIAAGTAICEEDIQAIALAFPRGLVALDCKGRSPLSLALDQLLEYVRSTGIASQKGQWGTTYEEELINWQKRQQEIWGQIEILLNIMVRLKKSINPRTATKMIYQSLQSGAPPSTILLLIKCSRRGRQIKIFQPNMALCAKCVGAIFEFSYPLEVLTGILKAAAYDRAEPSKKVIFALRRGLRKHYESGFLKVKSNRGDMITYSEDVELWHQHRSRMDGEAGGDDCPSGTTSASQDWFNMLSFLLLYATTNGPQNLTSQQILHIALSNPTSPISLIKLIAKIHPHARKRIDPRSGALPLHIACLTKCDSAETDASILGVLMGKHNSHWVWRRFLDRLPLHHALATGKTHSFIKSLVLLDCKTLLVRDPLTKLFPFQLAATNIAKNKNFRGETALALISKDSIFEARQYPAMRWYTRNSHIARNNNVDTNELDDLDNLTTLFELIRMNPNAIGVGAMKRSKKYNSRELKEPGILASHFLHWFYNYNEQTGWNISAKSLALAQTAIATSVLPCEMRDFWQKTLTLIWEEGSSGLGLFQREDRYLLHCAVSNPDVPPLAVEILLMTMPHAVSIALPGTAIYPVHIAASTPPYIPQSFESPISKTALQFLGEMTPRSILVDTSMGRSALHIAIDERKSRKELCQLAGVDKRLLLTADTETGLLPFQLLAMKREYIPEQTLRLIGEAKAQSSFVNWSTLSSAQKSRMIRKRLEKEEREILSTLYEFIRAEPAVVEMSKAEMTSIGLLEAEESTFVDPDDQSIEITGDERLVEMVLRQYNGQNFPTELSIEYDFEGANGDIESNDEFVEVVVHEAEDGISIDTGNDNECINDVLIESCERWRDVGIMLEQALGQHDRVSSQIAKSRMVLEQYDARRRTS